MRIFQESSDEDPSDFNEPLPFGASRLEMILGCLWDLFKKALWWVAGFSLLGIGCYIGFG